MIRFLRTALTRTEVRAALVAVLLARTAINGGYRIVYPFLPEIARGLGTTVGVLGVVLALRSLTGLAAPLVPRMSETAGRRVLMLVAALVGVLACLVVAGAPGLPVAAAGLILLGATKPVFDVPMQGWFGARVVETRRGRVLGVTELTWAASLLLAVPAGFLIAATSWRAAFVLVAAVGTVGLVALALLIRDDRPAQRVRRPLRLTRPLVTVLAAVALFRFAAEVVFIVYGSWLELDIGLTVAAIGVFTLVVVVSELSGELTVTAFADRFGLRRTVLLGLGVSAVAYIALGFVGSSLVAAILVVALWLASFEVTIVATIPLVTVLGGAGRERLLALVATVNVLGTGAAALTGPQLFSLGGIAACGAVAAACACIAALLLGRTPVVAPGSVPQ